MRSSFARAGVLGLLISVLSLSLVVGAGAQESPDTDPSQGGDSSPAPDPIMVDAAEVASMYGISTEEARARLERQPRIGQLQQALDERHPGVFGGLFIDNVPEYRVTLLARPNQGARVEQAVEDLGFSDLKPFVTVEETPFTLDVLETAMHRVGQLGGGKATTLDIDIRTGEVHATAATQEDVDALRAAVASSAPPVQARRVVVEVGGSDVPDHSYGGLELSTCTSGFSVRRTTDNAEGVSTAGHCQNSQVLIKHSTQLDFVAQKEGGSQDVQWHKTPGLNDPNLITDGVSTNPREITGRIDRSQMSIGDSVCRYGITSGYGCGTIKSKSYDPDGSGSGFNATFIRMQGITSTGGDSGGPWFLGLNAYGTHKSHDISSGDAIFMAQNYMSALNLVVKINP